MRFRSLHLQDIRSYQLFDVVLSDGVTVVAGPNGSGKTNLLESLYVLSHGSSFRGRDRDLLAYDKPYGVIKSIMEDKSERRISLIVRDDGKVGKEFIIGGTKRQRLSFAQRLPVVLFDPEGLRALSSSPARRRDFLDDVLGRLTPNYSTILHRYERSLLQRNELLKRQSMLVETTWRDQLFVWDVKLAELAEQLVEARTKLLAHYNDRLSDVYSELSNKQTDLKVQYHTFHYQSSSYRHTFFAKLQQLAPYDAVRGFTSVGPQRDDFEVFIGGHPALDVASRGEMRTIMLALKLIETKLVEGAHQTAPLLLLDDVFSELDTTRRQKLTGALDGYQTVITTTDADIVSKATNYKLIRTRS